MDSSNKGVEEKWIFTLEQVERSPSIVDGFSKTKELLLRRQTSNFIKDMGQQLKVSQLCINTAVVYCQRFYMYHSFQKVSRNLVAPAAILLATKVEEQYRKIEQIIRVAHNCLHKSGPQLDVKSESYREKVQILFTIESFMLQTFGFDVGVDHPHLHVVRGTSKVSASKELSQTSYHLASDILHNTTMCLRYSSETLACFCIFMANQASKEKIITKSGEPEEWIRRIGCSASLKTLNEMLDEYLHIELNLFKKPAKEISSVTRLSLESQVTGRLPNEKQSQKGKKSQQQLKKSHTFQHVSTTNEQSCNERFPSSNQQPVDCSQLGQSQSQQNVHEYGGKVQSNASPKPLVEKPLQALSQIHKWSSLPLTTCISFKKEPQLPSMPNLDLDLSETFSSESTPGDAHTISLTFNNSIPSLHNFVELQSRPLNDNRQSLEQLLLCKIKHPLKYEEILNSVPISQKENIEGYMSNGPSGVKKPGEFTRFLNSESNENRSTSCDSFGGQVLFSKRSDINRHSKRYSEENHMCKSAPTSKMPRPTNTNYFQ